MADATDLIVGKNIRLRRKRCGWSMKQLGQRLGVSYQQVQKYEKGHNAVKPSMLKKLSELFACSMHDLVYDVETLHIPLEATSPAKLEEFRLQSLLRDFFSINSPALQEHIRVIVSTLAREHSCGDDRRNQA